MIHCEKKNSFSENVYFFKNLKLTGLGLAYQQSDFTEALRVKKKSGITKMSKDRKMVK